jgi:hypothetical protein
MMRPLDALGIPWEDIMIVPNHATCELQAFACIYVEVDLEKGLSEAIQLTLDDWTYVQQVDYEQFPFKTLLIKFQKSGTNEKLKITEGVRVNRALLKSQSVK